MPAATKKKPAGDQPQPEPAKPPEQVVSEEDGLREPVVRLLLEHGADARAAEPAGLNTPLHLWEEKGF